MVVTRDSAIRLGERGWIAELRPSSSVPRRPSCEPAIWDEAVLAIGEPAASWALEVAEHLAELIVPEAVLPAWREKAALEYRPTCEAVVLSALTAYATDSPPQDALPEDTHRSLVSAVRSRMPLAQVLEGERAAHRHLSDALVRELRLRVPPEKQRAVLPDLLSFLVDHVATLSAVSTEAYVAEERRWLSSGDGVRAELVRQVLHGATSGRDLSARLRYPVDGRNHLALIVRTSARPTLEEGPNLESVARSVLSELSAAPQLVVDSGANEVWAWGCISEEASLREAHRAMTPGALIAVGTPSSGISGFRRSFWDAAAALRVASASPIDDVRGRLVLFDDVRLEALLTHDLDAARRFVMDVLGPLAQKSEASTRRTLQIYLETQCSPAQSAAVLGVAKNTVVYRVKRAESLLGRSIRDGVGTVLAALILAQILDPETVATRE